MGRLPPKTKTFSMAYLILVGRKYGSPLLNEQQTLLLNFVNQPAEDYCHQNSLQAKAFAEIMTICKAGWNAETSRKKKWTTRFVAENLALLLVIRREVEKDKETRRAVVTNRAATSYGAISSKWGIVHPIFIIIFSRCITYLNNCLLLCKS